MITTSESVKALMVALVNARKSFGTIQKNKMNPHLKNRYADLGSILEAVQPALLENGLMLTQACGKAEQGVCVTTRIMHTSGEWIDYGEIVLPVDKATAQAVGSALTYAKRYALGAALCVFADDDDDGNAASQTKASGREAAAALKAKQSGAAHDDFL